ncbi:MAG: chromate transporter [Planctomycetes bacterium]|nr:chromate transporter [Planctomycetota bacterium]MCC8115570.1 chromate transporter [Planctomycetota bacterium]
MRFYAELFMVFFRIGLFTIGGGYAMLPLIEREIVEKKRWIGSEDFLNVLAVAQSLPGPIAVNTGVFVGYKTRRFPGAVVGLLGVVMPSFICMIILATFFVNIRENPTVAAVFTGIRPAVAALIAGSVVSLGRKARLTVWTGLLALAAALAVWLGRLSPAWIVLVLACVGAMFPVSPARPKAEAAEEAVREMEEIEEKGLPR